MFEIIILIKFTTQKKHSLNLQKDRSRLSDVKFGCGKCPPIGLDGVEGLLL